MVGFAEGKPQEEPKDIIAAQIRSQGYACNSTQSAERDAEASAANQAVWMLSCQNASYRVTLIPNLAAKVEKVGEEMRREVQKATAPADKEASPASDRRQPIVLRLNHASSAQHRQLSDMPATPHIIHREDFVSRPKPPQRIAGSTIEDVPRGCGPVRFTYT